MIITILLTIIAYQFILFIVLLTDKWDNEKIAIILCGVWYLLGMVFVRIPYEIYQKLKVKWFNKHYSYCIFFVNGKEVRGAYIKNQYGNHLLNYDTTKDHYVRFDYEHKAKNLRNVNLKSNRNQDIVNDLFNPPRGWTIKYIKQFMR